jgi:hypothetical protein
VKYDHKAKPSREARESGRFLGFCQVCGLRIVECATPFWTQNEDGYNVETYWRHIGRKWPTPEPRDHSLSEAELTRDVRGPQASIR